MDRIKELSLDQKAKLYYMGLVRKGEIDRLPEDPKAAFVKDMMGRKDELKGIATELGYLNEEEDLTFEPEDMDNPDEDLVIIGSGYLDIKSNFKGRPNMTNDELATLGQKVVDQLHKGDKEAALNYIYSRINENINESKVNISYTDPGFRFYKMKVDGKRLNREEGTKYLKGLGIDMEIPRSYNETILDKIVSQLKEKGIDADHDAAMDVS